MLRKILLTVALFAVSLGSVHAQPVAKHRSTGAIPTPRHKLIAAKRHVPLPASSLPATFGVIPKQLNMWGNSTYGDCVSAEEAFAKACYSTMAGVSEVFIPRNNVVAWARQNGFLNGANLTNVMDTMAQSGMPDASGKVYTDGPYEAVNYSDDATLRSAIFQGPVKIGVAASQLQGVVGGTNGWTATGFRPDNNEDHCVALCGFGTYQALATMMGVQVPAGANPTGPAYLLYTWDTIGIIDQASMINITGEAWLRTPTTPQTPMPTPTPAPTPTPVPTPAPTGWSGTVTYVNGVVTSVLQTTGSGPAPSVVVIDWVHHAVTANAPH